TTQNLQVVAVDLEDNLILIKGSVPGSKTGWVLISDAVKKPLHKDAPLPAGLRAAGLAAEEEAKKAAAEAEAKAQAEQEAAAQAAAQAPKAEEAAAPAAEAAPQAEAAPAAQEEK